MIFDRNHTFYIRLAILLVAALASRLLILHEFLNSNPFSEVFFSDDWVYWVMAGAKAAGRWTEETPFLSAPLFPYLLGFIRWSGGDLRTVYEIQLILGLLSIFLLAVGTRTRFGDNTGLIAATLFAFAWEPTLAFTRVMADSLQLFLAILVWYSWSRLADRENPPLPHLILTGALTGLLALAWPPAQALLVIYGIWLWFHYTSSWQNRLLRSLIGAITGLLIISPATLHNYRTDGDLVLVSANAGINLLQGNNPNARGIITPLKGIRTDRQHMYQDMAQVYAQQHGQIASWKTMDAWYRDQALDFILGQPEKSIPLFFIKLYWFLTSRDYDNISVLKLAQEHGLYQWARLAPVELPWLMGLAFLGMILLLRNVHRYAPELSLLGLAVLVCVVFHYSARYRLPAAPILCIFTAVALTRWHQIPIRQSFRFGIAALPLLFLVLNTSTGFGNVDFMREDTAIKIAHAYVEVGDRRVRSRHYEKAHQQYMKAIEAAPEYPTPRLRLALLELKTDHPEHTKKWAESLLTTPATAGTALRLLYNTAITQHKYDEAGDTLMKLIKMNPGDLYLKQKTIWLLATCPDQNPVNPPKAVEMARELLAAVRGDSRIGALVTLAAAQLASGNRNAATNSLLKAEKLVGRSYKTESMQMLEKLKQEIATKTAFDCQSVAFKLEDPWDASKPHPMDLLTY